MNQSNLAAVFLTATLLLAGCDRATPSGAADAAPAFSIDGIHIDVGPQSPLRGELRVSPVVVDTTPSHVAWPTTVEIDPTRSIALVAPGSGRIVQVRVALGEKVRKNQVLFAMASGDVAQARLRAALTQRPDDRVVAVTEDAYIRVGSDPASADRLIVEG